MKNFKQYITEFDAPNIYCDMDGVITNFESRFEHFTGRSPKDYEREYGLEQFWHLIDSKIGVRFWVGMDWMPQGSELWNFISPYGPSLLTSPSRDNTSRLGKNLWVKNNLNPSIAPVSNPPSVRVNGPTVKIILPE